MSNDTVWNLIGKRAMLREKVRPSYSHREAKVLETPTEARMGSPSYHRTRNFCVFPPMDNRDR